MSDNKIKRKDTPYTTVAVKDGKSVKREVFQKYTLFVSRSTPGKLVCGSNVLFNRVKYIGLPEKDGLFQRVLSFNVF